jgi:hypothetical protein
MSDKKCPKCQYVRTSLDDEAAPDWQCPKCGVAYNKIGKPPGSKVESLKAAQPAASMVETIAPRTNLKIVAIVAILAGAIGAGISKFFDGDEYPTQPTIQGSPIRATSVDGIERDNVNRVTTEHGTELPPADDIQAEISSANERLRLTQTEYEKYSGGLIKSVLAITAALQRQTIEMLKQREASWTFGIGLRYSVDGEPAVLPPNTQQLLIDVEQEIQTARSNAAKSQASADRYSGGLIKATQLATAATNLQTAAMLEQKRLSLKYGLPQYIGFFDQGPSEELLPAQNDAGLVAGPEINPTVKDWEIEEVDAKVTETNDSWWRFAWRLTLKSTGKSDRTFDATIEFQDEDGFIIDSDKSYKLYVPAGSQRTFTGFALVRVPGASRVVQTYAKVRER